MKKTLIIEEMVEVIDYILKYSSGIGHDYIGKRALLELKENPQKLWNDIIYPLQKKEVPFEVYKEKLSLKGKNKFPRVISIPSYKDKIILKFIANKLNKQLENSLTQREICQMKINKITKLLRENSNYNYCLKIDIKDFYPSINHYILKDILLNNLKIKEDAVLIILKYLENPTLENKQDEKISNIKGLPQGIAISNILSECYLQEFDKRNSEIGYFRYVDDILIFFDNKKSCEDKLLEIKRELYKNYHLEINSNKTEIKDLTKEPVSYLGYKISISSNNKPIISVKDTNLKNFKLKIDDFFRSYNMEKRKYLRDERLLKYYIWKLNLLITGFKTRSNEKIRRYGWLNYYSNLNDTYILKKLDKHVANKLEKNRDLSRAKEKLKTFKMTFAKSKKDSEYIPNISDKYDTVEKKRNFIKTIGYFLRENYIDQCSDKDIENLFNELHFKLIREMERDEKIFFDSGGGI